MARIDIYANIHKSQRSRLFEVSRRAGRLGAGDEAEIRDLVLETREILGDIRVHSRQEDAFIHPWIDAADPSISARLAAQHHQLDLLMEDLEGALSRFEAGDSAEEWPDLYRAVNRFIASYLDHVDLEETVGMPLVWATYSEEEIRSGLQRFLASRSTGEQVREFIQILPTISHVERLELLRTMKASAPPETFATLRSLAFELLDPATWSRLEAGLLAAEDEPSSS